VDATRALPTGSYRIQGLDFEDVGFISPRGQVFRYVAGGSVSLGTWSLEEGLRVFFHGGGRVRWIELQPTAPRPPKAPTAPKEGEGEEPAKEGGGEPEGGSGGR
jgi:hypothetical protein